MTSKALQNMEGKPTDMEGKPTVGTVPLHAMPSPTPKPTQLPLGCGFEARITWGYEVRLYN